MPQVTTVTFTNCSQSPSPCALQCLVKWWAEYPAELLEKRVVRPLQQYLTDELFVTKKLTVSVMNVIKVLAKVEEANQIGRKLPPEAFYNELIRWAAMLLQVPCICQPACLATTMASLLLLACGLRAALQDRWPV